MTSFHQTAGLICITKHYLSRFPSRCFLSLRPDNQKITQIFSLKEFVSFSFTLLSAAGISFSNASRLFRRDGTKMGQQKFFLLPFCLYSLLGGMNDDRAEQSYKTVAIGVIRCDAMRCDLTNGEVTRMIDAF